MPGTFSTKLGWKKWVKSLENWCSSIKGENHIPLTYLIRDLDTPRDPRLPFSTEFERQRECTPHQGSAFKEDNNSLWMVMKNSTMNSAEAWPHVQKFEKKRDGRGAYKSLKSFFNGQAMMQIEARKAYTEIQNASYNGTSRNWTILQFTTKLINAYETLENLGEAYSETRKVNDLTDKIDVDRANNATLTAAVAFIKSSPQHLADFTLSVNYLHSVVMADHSTEQKKRTISQFESQNPPWKKPKNSHKFKGKVHGGTYSPKEWRTLTEAQKSQVRTLWAKKKERNASEVSTEPGESKMDDAAGNKMTKKNQK